MSALQALALIPMESIRTTTALPVQHHTRADVFDLEETAGGGFGIVDRHVEFAAVELELEDPKLFVLGALVGVHDHHLKS